MTALIILAVLILLIVIGFSIQPAPFAGYPQQSGPVETIPLPTGLPAPVQRYYQTIYGDRIPVFSSVILTGRAKMRPAGPFYLPARFRFSHDAGKSYRHYIEVTFFGLPVMKINERYVEGKSLFELPFGATSQGPKLEQGANLGMWAELMAAPAVFLTDPRVRWEAVDEQTAMLVVPFNDTEEHFTVRFDPKTGLPKYSEVMRYQGEESETKSLWVTESVETRWENGRQIHGVGTATWMQDGSPWAFFTTEDIRYNVDVQAYLRAKGL
jgi:hypothetical protein